MPNSGKLLVRSARFDDAGRLARRLRTADLQEIRATVAQAPEEVLQFGIEKSNPCYAVVNEREPGVPLAVFGVETDARNPGIGRIWFLGSDAITAQKIGFLRGSLKWLDELQRQYPVLWNFVDARNEAHIRWLRWCGFSLRLEREYGIEKRPFYEFRRARQTQASS